jgi:hypothetical protein
MLVDVHLDERYLAVGVGDRLFEGKRELLALDVPGGSKIDEDRLPH